MPDLKDPTNLHLVIFFIVPGLIASYVRARFVPGRLPSAADRVLSFLVLSLIYLGIVSPALPYVLNFQGSLWIWSFLLYFLLLIGPAIFGVVLGFISHRRVLDRLATLLRLPITDEIPTSWDWRFANLPEGGLYVLITLTDDRQVAGYFGGRSFASSEPTDRDLYIEQQFEVSDSGEWIASEERSGIYITGKEIRYVEFIGE